MGKIKSKKRTINVVQMQKLIKRFVIANEKLYETNRDKYYNKFNKYVLRFI